MNTVFVSYLKGKAFSFNIECDAQCGFHSVEVWSFCTSLVRIFFFIIIMKLYFIYYYERILNSEKNAFSESIEMII